jgi:hypothetical protein
MVLQWLFFLFGGFSSYPEGYCGHKHNANQEAWATVQKPFGDMDVHLFSL